MKFKIDTVIEDGKEYYVFEHYSEKIYINKETMLVEKIMMKEDGVDVVNSIYEIYTGNVKDEDVTPPDLTNLRQDIW